VSTTERLDQDFNSLDAQRESAEAFIESQKSEGWVCLPERYDDAGCTGANVNRPAFQKLLKDIKDGNVDAVVCYKIDRLSRSLVDFARIIEIFEKHGVSFTAITHVKVKRAGMLGRQNVKQCLWYSESTGWLR